MKPKILVLQIFVSWAAAAALLLLPMFLPQSARASTLNLSPSTGTFTVDSTFSVSMYINTEGKTINAVEASVSFPPDKLQLVSPTTGQSIITIWAGQPTVNNQSGQLDLQGGVPGGFNADHGLITTMTFRVKAVGTAVIRFQDTSKVLLNDGRGTNDLDNTTNGVYTLVLPPPAGPVVASDTHPDQTAWYSNPNVLLTWAQDDGVQGYSYVLNDQAVDVPDDIVDSTSTSVVYKNLSDGIHYFHIKALRAGSGWGGITNFAIHIDTTPPAAFPVEILPDARTTSRQPLAQFSTTDNMSGIDHYELKLLNLQPSAAAGSQPLFVEATSPYILGQLSLGNYEVMVRAFDKAGNFQEETAQMSIVTSLGQPISSEGLRLFNHLFPWMWVWVSLGALLLLLLIIVLLIRRHHKRVEHQHLSQQLPEQLQSQMSELQAYRERYGKLALWLLIFGLSWGLGRVALADNPSPPPVITVVARDITNQETFFVGGKADSALSTVTVYVQNGQSGATYDEQTPVDKKGEWFVQWHEPLPSGQYQVWAQGSVAGQLTPPSPEQSFVVKSVAVQVGHTIISYDTLNLVLLLLAMLAILALIAFGLYHWLGARRKRKLFELHLRQVQASIHRGFAIIKRDLQLELAEVSRLSQKRTLAPAEKNYHHQLQQDIAQLEQYVGKEIWELEQDERRMV